jgi:beta-glucosidase
MLGFWSAAGDPAKCVTLLEGVTNRAGESVKILKIKGCDVNDTKNNEIKQAIAIARKADFIILALGENREMSGEAASRSDISLPGAQLELAGEIIKTGKPVAVVLFNGRPLAIPELNKMAPAILESWFGGTQAGNAIADILFGDVNPSGKLTMTFPMNTGQIPIYYNSKNSGRPINPERPFEKYKSNYLDVQNAPLYPFGYGLSYTSFNYSGIKMNKPELHGNEQIVASVDITNTGDRDGVEIVQLYIRDLIGDVTRPVKELKGFKKVLIKKGETVNVTFTLSPGELSYYHQDMSFKYDPGNFELFIGTNSAESRSTRFSILD